MICSINYFQILIQNTEIVSESSRNKTPQQRPNVQYNNYQRDQMQEIIAQQYLRNNLNTHILALKAVLHRTPHAISYHAVTTYGDMVLVVEHYPGQISSSNHMGDAVDTLSFLSKRNKLMQGHPECYPLIYEQHVHANHPDQIMCITLMEPCLPLSDIFSYFQAKNKEKDQEQIQELPFSSGNPKQEEEASELYQREGLQQDVESFKNLSKLVLGAQKLNQNGLTLFQNKNKNKDILGSNVMYFLYSKQVFFDFTEIRALCGKQSFQNQQDTQELVQTSQKIEEKQQETYLNETQIIGKQPYEHLFPLVKETIISLMQRKLQITSSTSRIKEILFIKDRIYRFNPSFLNKASDFYELSFYLNIRKQDDEVDVEVVLSYQKPQSGGVQNVAKIVPHKIRETKIKHLEGNPKIIINRHNHKDRKQYDTLFFVDGKCTNSLVQLFYEELAQKFIVPNSQYKLRKYEMITVEITSERIFDLNSSNHIDVKEQLLQRELSSEKDSEKLKKLKKLKKQSRKQMKQMKEEEYQIVSHRKISEQIGYEDYLRVFPSVTKYQVINFLIAYLKCVEPVIHCITYHAGSNSLHLNFENKLGRERSLTLIFCDQYTIREEEISIIIQKSRIKACKVDIRMMQINDAFLMFLANSEKLSKIHELYLSDCHGMTDGGINVLLISPFCKHLKTLSLTSGSHLFDSAIESIGLKSGLRKLELIAFDAPQFGKKQNPGILVPQNNQVDLSKMKLNELLSMGIQINLSSLSHTPLKIIKINQEVPVEQLKHFRSLALTELKIKLVQGKTGKSLIQSFSLPFSNPLSSKSAAVKQFAEGMSLHTLKTLDIAGSFIKFKIIRQLFCMQELQKLILDGCTGIGNQFEPISPKILNLSCINLPINIQQLSVMLHKTSILVHLNVIGTKIGKKDLLGFISTKRKYINNLKISEEQYSNKLLDYPTTHSPVKPIHSKGKPFPSNVHSRSLSPDKRHQQQVFDYIENVEILINKLLENEQENQFHYLLYKTEKSYKTLRMVISSEEGLTGNSSYDELVKIHREEQLTEKKQLLMDKLNKYLVMAPQNLKMLRNLYIEDIRLEDLFLLQTTSEKEESDYMLTMSSNNVNLSTHSFKFITSPKVIFNNNKKGAPISFKILPSETIDKVTHRFVKFVKNCPDKESPISIDFSRNKLIGSSVIKMLQTYAQERIKDIDFRGCMFGYQDISDDIFDFTFLEELNDSQYCIHLNKQNFIKQSQKCLKFFMRIKPIKTLSIHCEQTQEIQILYSVLYHILEQHQNSIAKLEVRLERLVINFESLLFLSKIFEMRSLKELEFVILDCVFRDQKEEILQVLRDHFAKLENNLISLKIMMPSKYFPYIRLRNLENLTVEFSDNEMQETNVQKSLKHLSSCSKLKHLKILMPNAIYISNLSKLFSATGISTGVRSSFLEKMESLETLYLNFEYCPLKQQTVFELVEGLSKCLQLKFLELNISFAVNNLNGVLGAVETLLENASRTPCLRIICVTENSNKFVFNREQMHQKGAEFIL